MAKDKFKNGDRAPDFKTIDILGQFAQLSVLNQQGIWLALYRYSSCPMCNLHFDDVVSSKHLLAENNVHFLAVFESARENFPKKILSRRLDGVSIVSNPGREIYELYGAEQNWLGFLSPEPVIARAKAGLKGYMEGKIDGPLDRVPSHFLILPNGKIHTAHYGKNIADNLKWRDLQPFFADLKNQPVKDQFKRRHDDELDEIVMINSGVGPRPIDDDKTLRINPK